MPFNIGTTAAKKVFWGTTEIKKIFSGATQVWASEDPYIYIMYLNSSKTLTTLKKYNKSNLALYSTEIVKNISNGNEVVSRMLIDKDNIYTQSGTLISKRNKETLAIISQYTLPDAYRYLSSIDDTYLYTAATGGYDRIPLAIRKSDMSLQWTFGIPIRDIVGVRNGTIIGVTNSTDYYVKETVLQTGFTSKDVYNGSGYFSTGYVDSAAGIIYATNTNKRLSGNYITTLGAYSDSDMNDSGKVGSNPNPLMVKMGSYLYITTWNYMQKYSGFTRISYIVNQRNVSMRTDGTYVYSAFTDFGSSGYAYVTKTTSALSQSWSGAWNETNNDTFVGFSIGDDTTI